MWGQPGHSTAERGLPTRRGGGGGGCRSFITVHPVTGQINFGRRWKEAFSLVSKTPKFLKCHEICVNPGKSSRYRTYCIWSWHHNKMSGFAVSPIILKQLKSSYFLWKHRSWAQSVCVAEVLHRIAGAHVVRSLYLSLGSKCVKCKQILDGCTLQCLLAR